MASRAKRPEHRQAIGANEYAFALQNVERLAQLLERHPIGASTLLELVAHAVKTEATNRQKHAANKKHEQTREAKEFVIALWHKKRCQYQFNTEFALAASQQVLEKFKVSVKATTIARDWLRGVPQSRSMATKKGAFAYADGEYFGGTT